MEVSQFLRQLFEQAQALPDDPRDLEVEELRRRQQAFARSVHGRREYAWLERLESLAS